MHCIHTILPLLSYTTFSKVPRKNIENRVETWKRFNLSHFPWHVTTFYNRITYLLWKIWIMRLNEATSPPAFPLSRSFFLFSQQFSIIMLSFSSTTVGDTQNPQPIKRFDAFNFGIHAPVRLFVYQLVQFLAMINMFYANIYICRIQSCYTIWLLYDVVRQWIISICTENSCWKSNVEGLQGHTYYILHRLLCYEPLSICEWIDPNIWNIDSLSLFANAPMTLFAIGVVTQLFTST